MPEWTLSQQQVISSDAKELVCSAAAGSGKTAVMVERIIRFLREGAEPESFLIITFTNAAASEMKEKIRKRLYEEKKNPLLLEALDRIDQMQISTIHSFCQQLLRNQFHLTGMDPDFQICDTSQSKILFHQAFRDACEKLRQEQPDVFQLLKERFEIQKAESMIQNLYPFLLSQPHPMAWLEEAVRQIPESFSADHPWIGAMKKMAQEQAVIAECRLRQMYDLFSEPYSLEAYRESWKMDSELFHVKQSALESPEYARTGTEFCRLKTVRGLTIQESDWKSRYGKLRDEWKKQIRRMDELLMTSPEQTLTEWKNMKESLQAIQRLIQETHEQFQMAKQSRSLVDFQDLEQYAALILSDPSGLEEAHRTWRYIFVDECQDNSDIQNYLIEQLQDRENHLFMVGDVKQSIYRFRLADPNHFMERIERCRSGSRPDIGCIFLQSNFRSRPEILETTNRVFRTLMKKKITEIDYGPEEELIPGRKTDKADPVQVIRIERNEENLSGLEATAIFLKEEMSTLLQTPYPEKKRNYQYRDMVILMPAVQNDGPALARQLEKMNIPVFYDGPGDYYQQREVQIIRNLLEWIDDPLQDLPLISVLQESPFCFSEEELSVIRLKYADRDVPFHAAFRRCAEENSDLGEKCREVQRRQVQWRKLSEGMHVSELIWQLYHETGIYYVIGADPTGEVRQANLRVLARQAADAEGRGILTLRQFLAYMRDQQSYGEQRSATLLGDQDDLVRIMTIHKSKGLQFPIVFCAGMDKSPVGKEPGGILFHSRLGLCMDYKDPEHRISRPTLATEIFLWQRRREEMAEKTRLLYVAMTRPQEKLYLLTCQETNPVWSMPEGEGRILMAESFTDWWMPVLMQGKAEKISTGYAHGKMPYEIRTFESNQQENVENNTDIHSLADWLESMLSARPVEEMWKKTEEREKSELLTKRSVTSLIRSARNKLDLNYEEDLEEETPEKKRMPEALRRKLKQTEMADRPAYMKEQGKTTGARLGTLTHHLLSLMDLDRMRQGASPAEALEAEKEKMLKNHMAAPQELLQVKTDQVEAFWQSEMGRRILRADEVHREWNFNLLIRRDPPMLLQGVMDCAFREGDAWVILDYKTDQGKTAEELREEYRPQLLWYARAMEELTGQRVKETALYSLALNELVPVS